MVASSLSAIFEWTFIVLNENQVLGREEELVLLLSYEDLKLVPVPESASNTLYLKLKNDSMSVQLDIFYNRQRET